MNSFGAYLRSKREAKGMTVNQLGMYSEISAATISRIENGKRGVPKADTIKKLATALRVPYNEMMKVAGYSDDENEESSIEETSRQKKIRILHELADQAKTEKELDSAIIVLESIFKK